MCSRLVEPFTDDRDDVPLLPFLNTTTTVYNATIQRILQIYNRDSTFPQFGVLPSNNFVCNPLCVWGDCINNICSCY
jgi:hypothetical protein